MYALIYKESSDKFHIGELTLYMVPGIGDIKGMLSFYKDKDTAKRVLNFLDNKDNLEIIEIDRVIYEYNNQEMHVILKERVKK